jgi:hypothetical protein
MLNKAIQSGKEHRKPFRKAKRFDRSCRNHGGCNYCRDNRTFFDHKRRVAAELSISEYLMEGEGNYDEI